MMDGKGQCAIVTVMAIRDKQVGIEVMEIQQIPQPSAHIAVAVPICSRQTMAQLFDQGTQMGCQAFYPTMYAHSRSTGQHKNIDAKSQQRWQTILEHAAEQSEQAWLPGLAAPMDLETLCTQTTTMQKIELGFTEPMSPSTLHTLLEQPVLLCLGPEGGLTQEESAHIRAQGGQCLRLRGGILRVETALVAALATLQAS
jgi:16S rRNA (uracil1498-N3)-methyltransferase